MFGYLKLNRKNTWTFVSLKVESYDRFDYKTNSILISSVIFLTELR